MWYDDPDLGLLARNITVPGFSPLFPDAHCNTQYTVCQVTTGEAGEKTSIYLGGGHV